MEAQQVTMIFLSKLKNNWQFMNAPSTATYDHFHKTNSKLRLNPTNHANNFPTLNCKTINKASILPFIFVLLTLSSPHFWTASPIIPNPSSCNTSINVLPFHPSHNIPNITYDTIRILKKIDKCILGKEKLDAYLNITFLRWWSPWWMWWHRNGSASSGMNFIIKLNSFNVQRRKISLPILLSQRL